jgi:hypothetical protein
MTVPHLKSTFAAMMMGAELQSGVGNATCLGDVNLFPCGEKCFSIAAKRCAMVASIRV